jgi:AcrR family transcriptional regulator
MSRSFARQGRSSEKISGDIRKADLLEAALSVFSDKGYDGATLQDIAERTGILKGSIYYYYQSKEDILYDVLKMVHDEHLENVRALVQEPATPIQRLHRLLAGHAAFVCENLERATVFLREMERLPPDRQAVIHGPDQPYQRVFRQAIEDAQKAGQVASELSPKLAALWILGSLNWLHRWYRPERSRSPQEVGTLFADQLTRGIGDSPLWQRGVLSGLSEDR